MIPADNHYSYTTIANNLQRWSSSTWSTEASKDATAPTASSLLLHHRHNRKAERHRSIFSTTMLPSARWCSVIPSSIMQSNININIKQAPLLDDRRQTFLQHDGCSIRESSTRERERYVGGEWSNIYCYYYCYYSYFDLLLMRGIIITTSVVDNSSNSS